MKKIISIISIFLVSFLFADVQNPRYDDESVHLGLPSLVTFTNGFTIEYGKSGYYEIQLPTTHHVKYMGVAYKSIRVNKDGAIELFSNAANAFVHPKVSFINDVNIVMDDKFEWKAYVKSEETDPIHKNQDDYMVVINQSFKVQNNSFLAQIVLYTDGEIQVQLWSREGPLYTWPSWFKPVFDDGYEKRGYTVYSQNKDVDLINQNGLKMGLRSRWVAKSLLQNDKAIEISSSADGKSLHVSVDGGFSDLGGIVAYDGSREHPVVGSFSGVSVKIENLPSEQFSKFYCWYFRENEGTNKAGYPAEKTIRSGGPSVINLNHSDFVETWNHYKNVQRYGSLVVGNQSVSIPLSLLDDESIAYVDAPAFKFQRVGNGSFDLKKFSFDITSIEYHLNQLQSVQFLPKNSTNSLHVDDGKLGRVDIPGFHGEPSSFSNYVTYDVYNGQILKGSIIAAPGYEIEKIGYIAMKKKDDHLSYDSQFDLSVNENFNKNNVHGLNFVKISKERIDFEGSPDCVLSMKVYYVGCNKRDIAVTPAMVKTEVFAEPNAESLTESAVIKDGFGSVIQKQRKNIDGSYAVSTSYTNSLNQTTYTPMEFAYDAPDFKYIDLACKNCLAQANAYYMGQHDLDQPDAFGYAYSEMVNHNGWGASVNEIAGVGKQSFGFDSEKHVKTWSIPVKSKDDFIANDYLNEAFFKKMYDENTSLGRRNEYVLSIVKNSSGKFTQEIHDPEGHLRSSWYFNGQEPVVTFYDYDEFGKLIKTYLKNNENLSSEQVYDVQGRVIKKESSDRGKSESRYDEYGRIKFTRSAEQLERGVFSFVEYDDYGRSVAYGEAVGLSPNSFSSIDEVPLDNRVYQSKSIYGKVGEETLKDCGIPAAFAEYVAKKLEETRPHEAGALLSFGGDGKLVKASMANYDINEQIVRQWIVYGKKNVPPLQIEYEYDGSYNLTKSKVSFWNGSSFEKKGERSRSYNPKGLLTEIRDNGKLLATYKYSPKGILDAINYWDNGVKVMSKTSLSDLYGRNKKIRYADASDNELYTTELAYDDDFTAQADEISHSWASVRNVGKDINRKYHYEYDYNGLLSNVSGELNSSYDFDEIGRMTKKIEGNSVVEYSYSNQTYRPSSFSVAAESSFENEELLKYDASGNVWYDGLNNVVYKNSNKGLPLKIIQFSKMPKDITLKQVNDDAHFENVENVINVAYDDEGTRLWYSVTNGNNEDIKTVVTLPGFGTLLSSNASSSEPTYDLAYTDLVDGGYRDVQTNVAKFPIKDAQGNVRGYVEKNGVVNAYDYYPYGTVVNLGSVDSDNIHKRWQNKEYDEEHGKYFFGSRYFDPFLGLWMSPDPAGQFANPYTFGGDPVNFVDPNGEEAILAAAAIGFAVSAIIGGTTAAYQCTGQGTGSCFVAIGQSALIGGIAGAAGGAAGAWAGGAASGISGVLFGGTVGGAAGSAAGYLAGVWLTDEEFDLGDFGRTTFIGGYTGTLSAGIAYGWNQIPYLGWAEIAGRALSSSASSMVEATFNGEDVAHAGLVGLGMGAWNSVTTSIVSLGLVYSIGKWFGSIEALNSFMGTEGTDGEWMYEKDAVKLMKENPGMVSASVAEPVSLAIAILSGGGPFSHVRGSDDFGDIVENGPGGVKSYADKSYTGKNDERLTYVTRKYVGGQDTHIRGMTKTPIGRTVESMRGMGYFEAHLCVGATGMVNAAYKPLSPNGMFPWAIRNFAY